MRDSLTLSVVICTYNRPDFVAGCIRSIQNQKENNLDFEILIVNNSRDRETHKQLAKLVNQCKECSLHLELNPGLSIARNYGYKVSKGKWVFFIDDDAFIHEELFLRAKKYFNSTEYAAFGGQILSHWEQSCPKWLSPSFGSKPLLSNEAITLDTGYLWGSNLFVRRSLLETVNGFKPAIGMKGTKPGYGAENALQDDLRRAGQTILYDPGLIVYHHVLPEKYTIWWHIRYAYFQERDGAAFFQENYTLKAFLRIFKRILVNPPIGFYKLAMTRSYYIENLLLDVFTPWSRLLGKLRAIL